MKKMLWAVGIAMLMGMASYANVILIDDDFSTSTISSASRVYLDEAGGWVGHSTTDWSTTGDTLNSQATTSGNIISEGIIGRVYDVVTTDTSLTEIQMSFDYTVGAGSTLYFWANGLTTNGTPIAHENLYNVGAPNQNPQDGADVNFADISLLTGNDPSGNNANSRVTLSGGATGITGTYNVTIDLSALSWSADEDPGVTGDLANITDLDHLVFMFGNDVTVTDGTGAVSIDNFNVTAIPEPATLGLVTACAGAILFIRRRFLI